MMEKPVLFAVNDSGEPAAPEEAVGGLFGDKAKIFRPEALHEYISRDRTRSGDVLKIAPRWTIPVFWLVLSVCVVGLVFASVFTVEDYATGPAVLVRGDDGEIRVLAFLPWRFQPVVEPGMALDLDLNDAERIAATSVVEHVRGEVVGPVAARELAGPSFGDALPIPGPVVVVRARTTAIESEKERIPLVEGMHGTARLPVRSERVIVRLVPRLAVLFGESDG